MSIKCEIRDDGMVNIRGDAVAGNGFFTKVISLTEFSKLMRDVDATYETPILPKGSIQFAENREHTILAIDFPETRVDFHHIRSPDPINIPIPNSVWFVVLRKNKNGSYYLLKTYPFIYDMLLCENSELYKWPLPNYSITYSSGICWGRDGAIARSQDNFALVDMEMLFSNYFASMGNDDLSWGFKGDSSNIDYLNRLSVEDSMPINVLHRYNRNYRETFNHLISKLSLAE